MSSWLSRGLVSIADLAKWRFDDDESQVAELMKQTPGSMRDLLSLESKPEVGDDDEKKRVRDAESTLLPGGKVVKHIYIYINNIISFTRYIYNKYIYNSSNNLATM